MQRGTLVVADKGQTRLSWFTWVCHGATPKQRELKRQTRDLVRSLDAAAQRLECIRQDSETAITTAVAELRELQVESMLRELPVERLKGFGKSIRVAVLEANGFRTIADLLGVRAEQLERLHGIGPASASQIALGVVELHAQLQRLPFEVPSPESIGPQHAKLLGACFQRIRCRTISPELISNLKTTARRYESGLRDVRQAGAVWNRLFRRRQTERAVTAAFDALSHTIALSEHGRHLADADSTIDGLRPPSQIEALRDDFRSRFSDYGAVLDSITSLGVSVGGGVSVRARDGGQGNIPEEIARRVEAQSLRVEGLDVDLRGYQEFGAKYLVCQKRAVLGDEMGLGKTIQALAVIVHLKNTQDASRFLVVCPASVIGNWVREIKRRTRIPARLLHGSGKDDSLTSWQRYGGIAITSYETLRTLELRVPRIHFSVVDEAHFVKNPEAQRSKDVLGLASISERIVLMTGTALENHPREFVNLIRVCNSSLASRLCGEQTSAASTILEEKRFGQLAAPVYLRRNQADVLRELPVCIEVDELITLPVTERNAYFRAVDSGSVMAMRQAANGQSTGSAKLQRLAEILEEYRSEGKKVVVFSYFLRALDLVGELVGEHSRIDGSVPVNRRMQLIDAFNGTPGFAVLVCQISAGGIGINLQTASAVVLLEPQFKPTTEWQAIKRVHRMGQASRVVVHRFVARETVDESLRLLLEEKTDLFNRFARESAIKNASPAATDTTDTALIKRLLEMESARRKAV